MKASHSISFRVIVAFAIAALEVVGVVRIIAPML